MGRVMTPNYPFFWGAEPHVMHDYLGRPEFTTQTASRLVQPFWHSSQL